MGLFGKSDGGLMDVIRCDETDYLIWKWQPRGSEESGHKMNSVRWGSSIRVIDGSVAVFLYKQKDGTMYDYIEGPYDGFIETNNLPVLTDLLGTLYNGDSPFQAEIYFINIANLVQTSFGVPFFDVFDPRFIDYGVPVAVRGSINYRIADYREFVRIHRLQSFSKDDLDEQIRTAVARLTKNIITNAPIDLGIPVVQLERHISELNALVEKALIKNISEDYGISISRVDISDIEIDKESKGYKKLEALTQNKAATFVHGAQSILETVSMHSGAGKKIKNKYKDDIGTKTVGDKVSDAIGSVFGKKKNESATPPPIPTAGFYVAIRGEQKGPFDVSELAEMYANGEIDGSTLVWKEGMADWLKASEVKILKDIF